ncbi:hypothetical protein K7432_008373 [Basidiobolus ranarum]|uniref:Phosphatidate cytidylyltransferase n=1 Tax=Basidiobolus ranarum TaxID=34480 RepID=A0ABR2WS14_9FUNG
MVPAPTNNDLLGLVFAFIYCGVLLTTSEVLRWKYSASRQITRKLVHVGAGLCNFFHLYLFDQWQYACIPMASFIPLNYLFLRFRLLNSIDPKQGATFGTVYFVISCSLLCLLFHEGWEQGFPRGRAYLGICGIMGMTFGDSLANYVGKKFGKRKYPVYGNTFRTVEGSKAAFLAIFTSVYVTFYILTEMSFTSKVSGSFIAALVGTLSEAVSPFGTDNLTVPLNISFTLWLLDY